ncbi:MAG: TlpA disulfide reductase family protein [Candidatus Omnitrophota bacterium]
MKKMIAVLVVLSALLLSPVSGAWAEAAMSIAPDFTLKDTAGNTINLAAHRNNQPAILFFWTTWCPFCRDALKELNSQYADLTKAGWKVVPVDVGESFLKVTDFLKSNPLSFNVLLDDEAMVSRSYEVVGIPTYVLINKEGVIVFRDNYLPEGYAKLLAG